jgi:hypothetical protein
MRKVVMPRRNDHADDNVDDEQQLSHRLRLSLSGVIRRVYLVLGSPHEVDDHQHDENNHDDPADSESAASRKHVASLPTTRA